MGGLLKASIRVHKLFSASDCSTESALSLARVSLARCATVSHGSKTSGLAQAPSLLIKYRGLDDYMMLQLSKGENTKHE
jgi:hypothetical protein